MPPHYNRRPGKTNGTHEDPPIPAAVRAELLRRNALDIALYAWARNRTLDAVREHSANTPQPWGGDLEAAQLAPPNVS